MKTLYISDLDGTLLNEQAEIDQETRKTLCSLIGRGMHFTVATARTAATVTQILDGIPLSCPAILMNGVVTFDLADKQYEDCYFIGGDALEEMLNILRHWGSPGFLYRIDGEGLHTAYVNLDTPHAAAFVEERVKRYGKRFERVTDFADAGSGAVYYSVSDRYAVLTGMQEALASVPGLHLNFYRDVYADDFWYLELSSCEASKYHALMTLRKRYGYDRVICFGDNLNDLPLFAASDYRCAVENAHPELKRAADCVISSHREAGVARYLEQVFSPDNG